MDTITILLYYLINMQDLIFLHSQHYSRCKVHMDKHFDGYFTLQYMASGGIELSYGERTYTLTGRWFWPHFPGPRTILRPARGHAFWDHRYVAFKGPLAGQWAADGLLLQAPQASPGNRRFEKSFDALLQLVQRSDAWGHRRAVNQLERILLELAEARAQPGRRGEPGGSRSHRPDPWLERVLERLTQEPEGDFDYSQLAKQSCMALSTLRRRFREASGTALHTYALQCRVAAARKLLGETNLSIKDIAQRTGYRDVYFFSRQFHRHTGVPPATYRKSRLNKV